MTRAARIGRPAALALVASCAALFVWGIVLGAVSERPEPVLATILDPWTEAGLRAAVGSVPLAWIQGWFLVLQVLPAAAGLVAAVLLLRGASTLFRCYAAVVLGLFGTMSGAMPKVFAAELGTVGDVIDVLQGLAWVGLFPLMYLFPDGRVQPRWARWAILGWALLLPYLLVVGSLGYGSESSAQTLPLLPLFGSAAVAAVVRYRRISTPEQRAQTRGVVAALVLWFALVLATVLTPLHDLIREVSGRGLTASAVYYTISYAITAMIPAAITVGILRYRLYDVDVWVNRTLVYVALSAVVVVAYGLVALLGTWLWRDDQIIGPMTLAVGLGVGFQPLRSRVQRTVDRLVYGRRKERYDVLTDLGRQLAAVVPPDEVLATLVRQVGDALKLPFAAASLVESGLRAVWPSNAAEPASGRREEFQLAWQGEELGRLVVVSRPGDNLSAADRDLLQGLARQAGAAARAASLNDHLRRSRERIVDAREGERRRLQRDLHDGLGPTLASLYQRIDLARSLVTTDPAAAERLLGDIGERTRSVIAEIRALVRALRPPELDLGLAAAIEASTGSLSDLRVAVEADSLPHLAAAVETAAYRIAVEALTNAARHAAATSAQVSLVASDSTLKLTVVDDGRGLPAQPSPGAGLRSMRERADELGGSCEISTDPGGGTRVVAALPLRQGES